jgi:hypothetical protein
MTTHAPTDPTIAARMSQAATLKSKLLTNIQQADFYYPAGEPEEANEEWEKEHGSDEIRDFWKLQGALWLVLAFNVGLVFPAFVIRALGPKVPHGDVFLLLFAVWWWGCTAWAMWARSRIHVSVFDYRVWHAFEQAKTSADPWRMARWLGRAYHLVQNSPCLIKKLHIWQANEGIKTPNSFDFILHKLKQAGGLVLESFSATGSRREDLVAEGRFNELMNSLIEDTKGGPLALLKNRWTITAHRLAWAIAFVAITFGTAFLVVALKALL